MNKSALFALVLSAAFLCAGPQALAAKAKHKAPASTPVAAAPATPTSTETTLEVKAKLDSFAKMQVGRANETLQNNRAHVTVSKMGNGYVARYTEIDPTSLTTEIYPGSGPGCLYVGHIVYLEKVYESTGKTVAEAKAGNYTSPRARRIRELTRYDGTKWIY